MENKKTLYTSKTYNALKAFLLFLPVYASLIGLIIFISIQLHKPLIAVFGWVIISSVPFLFQKSFKNYFTRRVELEFDNQEFLVKEYNLDTDVLINELNFFWADIQSFKCSFSSSNTIYLVIYLKGGSSKSFSFKDEKDQEEALNEKSVFSIFYYYVRQYNSDKKQEEEITLKPGFLTTKPGAFVLYSLVILAVIGIVIHFVLAPKTFMLSFMSFFIIMGLLVKRKTDKDLYNKINKLEPKPPTD